MAVHRSAARPRRRAGRRALNAGDAALLQEIRDGLLRPQKELPSKLFYDERGSELFEEITRLPEYYLTRTEQALLREHVPGWIAQHRPRTLVELGAGNARKTRIVLDAMRAEGCSAVYVPVDISTEFLERTAVALRAEYPGLEVAPVHADLGGTLTLPAALPGPVLFTFLGSTIGNFTAPEASELLRRVRSVMNHGDRFLLGADLHKDTAVLEAAYDDARGVTADFNLNILRVINHRFGADFDIDAFSHRAVYDASRRRIEMHLVAARPHTVHVPGAGDFTFAAGETIRTEISCKYDRAAVEALFASARLDLLDWATDPGTMFALALGDSSTSVR